MSPHRLHFVDGLVRNHLEDTGKGVVTGEFAAVANVVTTGVDSDRLVATATAGVINIARCRISEDANGVNAVMTAKLCVLGDGTCLFSFYRVLAGIAPGTWSATVLPGGIIETRFGGNFQDDAKTAGAIRTGLSELNTFRLAAVVSSLLKQPAEAEPLTPDYLAPFDFFVSGKTPALALVADSS